MLVYDVEIKKAILGKGERPLAGIQYCSGWKAFDEMGISCIGVYDYQTDRYRVFMDDNLAEFQEMVNSHNKIVGFNSMSFDNKLCEANGITFPAGASYDILVEIWKAVGLPPEFNYKTHGGFSLDAICAVNFNVKKTGHGAMAPIHWQHGKVGTVIDYCLQDVALTKKLMDKIIRFGEIKDPRNPANSIKVQV